MARHLSDHDVEQIVGILDGWTGQLSWDLLCGACKPVLGAVPARQTLYRFARIGEAFKATKLRLKNGPTEMKAAPSMRVAMERIARLTVENERLSRENNHLLEQFVVWQYNAHIKGLSDADLNRALPSIDRGNTA
jgi:hypothetical protein